MLQNYLKIAFRNLWKRRGFSLINIFGLSVGMTSCFFIFLYVQFELSYDGFHQKGDRIYRVVCDIKTANNTIQADGPSWPVLPNMKNAFPEIESAVRTVQNSLLVRTGEVKFQEERSLFADPGFFQVFDFPLLQGDPRTVLKDPFCVVFSESAAKKYFGNRNPVGQTVLLAQKGWPVKVTGLMKDLPENSQVQADMIVSMSTETQFLNRGLEDYWDWSDYHPIGFILLRPHTDAHALQRRFGAFMEKIAGSAMKSQQMQFMLSLERLGDVHLYSTRGGSKTAGSKNVYLFSFIAAAILLIACINFVNLATARAPERAKEVGIRKVVGAVRPALASQFIGESIMFSLMAWVLSIGFIAGLIPLFNQLADRTISEGIFAHPGYLLLLLLAALLVGMLAGFYPAIVLASFRPASVLQGRFTTSASGNSLRKILVLVQFSLSISFIIASIVAFEQLQYMRQQSLGFNKDQILVINTEGDPARLTFQQSLSGLPGVLSATLASSVPGTDNITINCELEDARGNMQVGNMDSYFVDWDYVNQYHLQLAAGRSFSRDYATDTAQAMLINETAARMLGYSTPSQALGRRFRQFDRQGKIVGVLRDFHFHGLQQQIEPLVMRIEPQACFLVSVKVSGTGLLKTMDAIQRNWRSIIPHRPFLYYFLDEFFDRQYRSEERFAKLFLYFTALAIFISCMGLFGLASYSTLQRSREIALRKVLGASFQSIVNLLSRDFLLLIAGSFLVAAPLASLCMNGWLRDFAYRITISWWVVVGAGLLALVIAVMTISYQAFRAAAANPVTRLRAD